MVKHGQCCARTKLGWGLLIGGIVVSWFALGTATGQPTGSALAFQAGSSTEAGQPAAQAFSRPAAKPSATAKETTTQQTLPQKASGTPPRPKLGGEREVAGKQRDPFKLPPPPTPGREGVGEQITGPLPPGTRGLIISQLRLEGIVILETTKTMIAVVDNNTNRAYFLRENDAVYNGVVSKITPDSVLFTENFLDPNGRMSVREVVKRLGPGPGEGR